MGDAAPSRARVAPKGRLQRRRPTYITLRRKIGAREAPFVRERCENAPSGEKLAPEAHFRTESRPKPRFRRPLLAGGRISAAAAHETFPPASFPRRRGTFIRNPVGSPPPGVIFSPEAHFRAGHNDVGTKPSSGAFSPEAQSPPPSPPHTRLECQMLPASARTSARANALARGRHQAPPANTGSLEAT